MSDRKSSLSKGQFYEYQKTKNNRLFQALAIECKQVGYLFWLDLFSTYLFV